MEYLYYYLAACAILAIGYMIGVRDERENGPAACQRIMDEEIAQYRADLDEWDELANTIEAAEIDFAPASKRIKQYEQWGW
jgi:hypothetical protein